LLRRIKRRYLALEIDSDEAFGSKELMDAIWNAVSRLFGEHGASKAGLTLIDYDVERRLLVVRVAHTALDMVYAALASITRIQDKPVAVHVITVSGTIKTLYKRIKP
jgi:ribonuclease P/MRP protein subunit POP5